MGYYYPVNIAFVGRPQPEAKVLSSLGRSASPSSFRRGVWLEDHAVAQRGAWPVAVGGHHFPEKPPSTSHGPVPVFIEIWHAYLLKKKKLNHVSLIFRKSMAHGACWRFHVHTRTPQPPQQDPGTDLLHGGG